MAGTDPPRVPMRLLFEWSVVVLDIVRKDWALSAVGTCTNHNSRGKHLLATYSVPNPALRTSKARSNSLLTS